MGPRPAARARLGLLTVLVVGVSGLALATRAQVGSGVVERVTEAPAPPPSPSSLLAFGSTTASGAVVFRVATPVHVWMVDATGAVRWQRDYSDGTTLGCGPCPTAVLRRPDGRPEAIGPEGAPEPAPTGLGPSLTALRSGTRVVFGASDASHPGRVHFFVATSGGLRDAGTADGLRLAAYAEVVAATDGSGVTVFQASADPLRQADFEVVRISPSGVARTVESLPALGDRPEPCESATGELVGWMFAHDASAAAPATTQLVVERPGAAPIRTRVPGWYGGCAVGPQATVVEATVSGADGDLGRSRVDVVRVSAAGAVGPPTRIAVGATEPSVALDPATGRVAVAGSTGAAVVLDGIRTVRLAPASAVAFDDQGGLWAVDRHRHVTRTARP